MFQQFGIKRENITSVDLWQRHVSERLFFHIEVPQVKIICSGRGLQFDVVIHVDLEHIIQGKLHGFLSTDAIILIFVDLLFFDTKTCEIGVVKIFLFSA